MSGDQGFTFAEIMVALTITALITALASFLYVGGYRSYIRNHDNIEVQENLRIVASRMTGTIKQADPGSILITKPGNDSGQCIEFNLSFSGKSAGYRFDAVEKEIEEKNQGKSGYTWLPIASHVTNLVFTRAENSILITIKLKKGKSDEMQFNTAVKLRVGETG